jgi:hypothetical protein
VEIIRRDYLENPFFWGKPFEKGSSLDPTFTPKNFAFSGAPISQTLG